MIGLLIVGLILFSLIVFLIYVMSDYNFVYYNKPIHIGGKRCWINKRKRFKVRSFGSDNEFIINKEDAKFSNNV